MFKRKIIPIILLIISITTFILYNIYFREDANNVEALSKYGSRGNEVKQIQTKLKRWGYYYGNIDGIYGLFFNNNVSYPAIKYGLIDTIWSLIITYSLFIKESLLKIIILNFN